MLFFLMILQFENLFFEEILDFALKMEDDPLAIHIDPK